jgi:hypothetical protein
MFDRWLRWGAPGALLAVALLHPLPDANDIARSIGSSLLRWQAVHVAQLLLFPLVALAAYRLLPLATGMERSIARVGFAVFAVAGAAFDAMIGLGTGTLVAIAGSDPARISLVQDYWWHRYSEPVVGIVYLSTALGWLVGIAATAVAVRKAGTSLFAVGLLAVSALLAVDHTFPFGPAAMVALLAATAVIGAERRKAALPASEGDMSAEEPTRSRTWGPGT